MQQIKFSHNYYKMPEAVFSRKSYLLGVEKIHYKNLPNGFVVYDTIYASGDAIKSYPLPKVDLIILAIFTDSPQTPRVWTTARRYTPKKYQYYKSLIGSQVEIVLTSTTSSKKG